MIRKLISANGYTLIEILVSLTVIGLIFSLGYAGYRDFSRRQTIANAAKLIQGDLRFAQGNAMAGQKPEDCDTTLDTYEFKVISVNPPAEYRIVANCGATAVTVKDVFLPSDIYFSNASPIPPLKFKVLGQGTNLGSDWTLSLLQTGSLNQASVTVTSGGEIK